ncbi:MAG: ABC transporter substrate-binding protein [Candidatus Izemoplasmataceae bacterium]
MKKLVIVFMLVFSIGLLAACDGDDDTKELVIASIFASEVSEQELYQSELFEPFEEEHDVEIRFEQLSHSDMMDKLEVEQSSEEYTVDIIIEHYGNMLYLLEEDYVEDLSDLEDEMDDRTFIDTFDENTHKDGNPYFFPINADVYVSIANKDAFDDLPSGLSEDDLKDGNYTWDDFVEWANNMDGNKVFMKAKTREQLTYQVGGMALSHGGEYPKMNDDGNIRAWEDVLKMKDAIHPESINNAVAESLMGDNSTYLAFEHMAVVSAIYEAAPAKYEILPGPKGTSDNAGSIAGGHGIGIAKNAPERELAEEFIKFVTSEDKIRHTALGTIPPIEEAQLGDDPEDEVLEIAYNTIENANVEGLQMIPDYSDWSEVKGIYDNIYEGIMDGSIDESNLESELDDAQAELEDLYEGD